MRLEDVKPGRWVIYTAGHPKYGDCDRVGQIGKIKGFCGEPLSEDEPNEDTNIDVEWLHMLHDYPHGGGVWLQNIELLGTVEAYEEGEKHGNR